MVVHTFPSRTRNESHYSKSFLVDIVKDSVNIFLSKTTKKKRHLTKNWFTCYYDKSSSGQVVFKGQLLT